MVCIVGYDEAFWEFFIHGFFHVVSHDQFEDLGSFASWSCAHVHYRVVRLDVAEDGRHHAHKFLPGQKPCSIGIIDKLVNLLERLILLEQLLWHHELKDHIIRVPTLVVHFESAMVHHQALELVFVEVILIIHSNLIRFRDMLARLNHCVLLEKLWVVESFHYLFEIVDAWVHSESDRQLGVKCGLELLKFFLGLYNIFKLSAVVLIKLNISNLIFSELVIRLFPNLLTIFLS